MGSGAWSLVGSILGPQGSAGADGSDGAPGADGSDGAPGTTLHSGLSDVTADQHHAQLHASSHLSGGNDAIFAETVPSTLAFGDTAIQGADASHVAKLLHRHAMPANPVVAHEAAGDPHTGYRLESADHTHASSGTQAGQIAHSALTGLTTGDDHTQYQRESEKAAASGYASLDAGTKVPLAQLPTGTTSATVALGDAAAALDATHAAAADPHTGYVKENDASWVDLTDGGASTLHSHAGGGGPAFPVGAVFIAVVSTDPATLLGYGTWSAFGTGRVLVGLDSGDANFDTVEETGGAKTVAASAQTFAGSSSTVVVNHVHNQTRLPTATGGTTGFTVDTSMSGTPATTGVDTGNPTAGGAANYTPAGTNTPGAATSVVQPYIVVYMWKRTA